MLVSHQRPKEADPIVDQCQHVLEVCVASRLGDRAIEIPGVIAEFSETLPPDLPPRTRLGPERSRLIPRNPARQFDLHQGRVQLECAFDTHSWVEKARPGKMREQFTEPVGIY